MEVMRNQDQFPSSIADAIEDEVSDPSQLKRVLGELVQILYEYQMLSKADVLRLLPRHREYRGR